MHIDTPDIIAKRIADVKERQEKLGLSPMKYGVAAYLIIRNTEQEVKNRAHSDVKASATGYSNYQQWLNGTQLEKRVSLEDYSVSNRSLRSGLTETPDQVAKQIYQFKQTSVDFFLLPGSPQLEERERFAQAVTSS